MISEQVRAAEPDIDERIRQLPVWNGRKTAILRRLMKLWRDGLELAYIRFGHAAMFQSDESLEVAIALEHDTSRGVFWCIKWAFEYAQASSRWKPTDEELLTLATREGVAYQVLVDALKFATVEGVEIDADIENQLLTIFEGGNVSGHDHAIVRRDQKTVLFHKQCALVEDSDQLTERWTAGEYREYWRWLSKIGEAAETETVLAQAGPLVAAREMFKRPVVVRVPEPPTHLRHVHEDLTLTQQKIDSGMKWKLSEYQDCPLVRIGSNTYAVSSVIRALASLDDYMLRIAVLTDEEQYVKVSGLREGRMVAQCESALRAMG